MIYSAEQKEDVLILKELIEKAALLRRKSLLELVDVAVQKLSNKQDMLEV